jgi:hypothetical protein
MMMVRCAFIIHDGDFMNASSMMKVDRDFVPSVARIDDRWLFFLGD